MNWIESKCIYINKQITPPPLEKRKHLVNPLVLACLRSLWMVPKAKVLEKIIGSNNYYMRQFLPLRAKEIREKPFCCYFALHQKMGKKGETAFFQTFSIPNFPEGK